MALRPQRRCRLHGCSRLTRSRSGFCEEHEHGHRKAKGDTKQADPIYLSSRWRRVRLWHLSGSPLCELCGAVAVLVHHKVEIKAGGDPFLEDNLMSVCQECHNRIHGGSTGR